jgi:hypothetical protein
MGREWRVSMRWIREFAPRIHLEIEPLRDLWHDVMIAHAAGSSMERL